MKITFLGTSHGVPAADRFCSSTMLETGGKTYLIDAGAPIADLILRYGKEYSDVTAIFTTHSHADHVDGLFSFLNLSHWYFKTASVDVYLTEQAFLDGLRAYKSGVSGGRSEFDGERIRFHISAPEVGYSDEYIKVSFIPTCHMGDSRPSYAILIEAEGKRVLFTGDMSHKLEKDDFPNVAFGDEKLDLVVCEMAHFGVADLRPYLDKLNTARLCSTHVFPLVKYDHISAAKSEYPFEWFTPNDGDVIEI